jgi:hypothetical protein
MALSPSNKPVQACRTQIGILLGVDIARRFAANESRLQRHQLTLSGLCKGRVFGRLDRLTQSNRAFRGFLAEIGAIAGSDSMGR